jgi:hypothetical protein
MRLMIVLMFYNQRKALSTEKNNQRKNQLADETQTNEKRA